MGPVCACGRRRSPLRVEPLLLHDEAVIAGLGRGLRESHQVEQARVLCALEDVVVVVEPEHGAQVGVAAGHTYRPLAQQTTRTAHRVQSA